MKAPPKLGFWQQVALIFFTVSGGAYGLEALVGAVGAQCSLILVLVLPLIWAVPTALMVAELSAAIPEEGGYYVWVRRGLGSFWGFQEGWWTLCYSAVDMALYPVLFVTYLSYFFPGLASEHPQVQMLRWGICIVFVACALLFNLRGSHVVGMNALANLLIVSFPFALLTIWGLGHGDWGLLKTALFANSPAHIAPAQIAAGLAIVLWNYCGWDNISTYAPDVEDPAKNYPRAISMALVIITLSYVLPLIAGFKSTVTPADWGSTSGWPAIAERIGGRWLGVVGAGAALLSAWALFNSQLLYVSRLPSAMAKDGYLPRALARVSSKGVPFVALLTVAAFAALFSSLSLAKLMVVDILFYTLGLSLEFFALSALRNKEPQLPRPFKIPLSGKNLIWIGFPPIALATMVALFSTLGSSGSFLQIGIVFVGVVSGMLLYRVRKAHAV